MEYALEHLAGLLGIVLAAIITIALWDAVLKTGRNTQSMLAELRKTNAILLAAFGLEEGPSAKGIPRIVKVRKGPPEPP